MQKSKLNTTKQSNMIPMLSITVLFFIWGFITSLNDILIPYLKGVYSLSHFEANIVQFAFFIAYFVGSLIFYFQSKYRRDLISKYGYKMTLVIGLVISSLACFLFAMAAYAGLKFGFFLLALFMLGLGLTCLQIAANPFVAILGNPDTASSRLNLSQAFNSLGTTLGPALGGYFIFTIIKQTNGASAVIMPYIFLAILLMILAFFIFMSKINDRIQPSEDSQTTLHHNSIFKKPYVVLGALGIFFYVGAEVAIGSNLVSYLKETAKMSENVASSFLSYYWGGAMIGRFLGAISLSKMRQSSKAGCMLLLSAVGFAIVFAVNYSLHDLKFNQVAMFLAFVLLNFGCFFIGRGKAAATLAVFSVINVILISLGIVLSGDIAIWSLLSIGLFNSIMWSNVFTLAIDRLGSRTAEASSVLIMMILGGALLPPAQGWLADVFGIRISYIIPLISYLYLLFYGLKGFKAGKH
ncbi:MAG: sugar MFS transporter [Bacteroidales bacterium]|jgi:FHS family L-fucose permease-like MFS transporter|nr:sugar MFS transporter [Bacteroidales bacterium]